MRLKDADKLVEILDEEYRKDKSISKLLLISFAKQILSDAPTVEAEPVRHGHWDYIEEYFADRWWNTYQCSACGHQEDFEEPHRMKYCPECGAKMEGVTE